MDEITWLCDLARRAGETALAGVAHLRWELKSDRSFVTNLDREVECTLREHLRERFPGDAIWGEEEGGELRLAGRTWVIDPIDGTTNLVHGIPIWGVSVGLVEDGQPVLGVAYLPVTSEIYWFRRGAGAFWNDRPLHVTKNRGLAREDVVAISYEAYRILDVSRLRCRQRSLGSVVAHLTFTARGSFRATVSRSARLHDLGAALGLALEAGCGAEWFSGGTAELSYWFEHPWNEEPLLVGPTPVLAALRGMISLRPDPLGTGAADGE